MKGILTLIVFGMMLTTQSYSNGPTGTARVDETNLEELKKNNKILEKEEQEATKKVHQKQIEKYKVPGAGESKDSPIFRQQKPTESDD